MAESDPHAHFPTTCWGRLLRIKDPAALAELCKAYWYPIYAYVRRQGHHEHDAHDLTQAFFARLLEKETIAAADPARGRFRAFLLADCRFFLADARDRERALKRGGGLTFRSLDPSAAESRYRLEPAHLETPERLYERAWAMALVEATMAEVARHYADSGRAALFEALAPLLASFTEAPSQAEVAARLGTTPGAVQVALHRARARFGKTLRHRVAATLDEPTPAEVDDEVRALFAALAR